jgi:hypothetical protein
MKIQLISLTRLARAIDRKHRVHCRLHRKGLVPAAIPPSQFVPLTGD